MRAAGIHGVVLLIVGSWLCVATSARAQEASSIDDPPSPAATAASPDAAAAPDEGIPSTDGAEGTDVAGGAAPDLTAAPSAPAPSANGPCIGTSSPAAARVCEGLALATVRRWADAERVIESALELTDPMVEARRAQLEAALGQARAQLGSLEIQSTPEGVRISIDGVLAGTTPLERPLRLLPGDHLVRGTLADHDAAQEIAVVDAGDLTLTRLRLSALDHRPVLERIGAPGEAQRVVGLTALSLGVVSLAVGLGTLVGATAGMPPDVETLLTVSRATLIAGGVLFIGGIVLAITA